MRYDVQLLDFMSQYFLLFLTTLYHTSIKNMFHFFLSAHIINCRIYGTTTLATKMPAGMLEGTFKVAGDIETVRLEKGKL